MVGTSYRPAVTTEMAPELLARAWTRIDADQRCLARQPAELRREGPALVPAS